MKFIKHSVLLSLVLLLLPAQILAAGIQVSPARLEFAISGQGNLAKEITVANPTGDVQLFEISADEFEKAISIAPQSFTLESGDRKTVTVSVDPSALKFGSSQLLATDLSIVSRPLAEAQGAIGTGVKLPLAITAAVAPDSRKLNAKMILLIAVVLTGFAVLILQKKRNKVRLPQSGI